METVFENVFVDNVEMIAEINRKVWAPNKCPLGCFIIFCAFVVAAISVWQEIWSPSIITFIVFLLCYGIYNVIYHRFWAIHMLFKIMKENDGQIPAATVTVADKFIWQYKSTTISFSFMDVDKVYFLKHSIRIINKDNAYMTFQCSGFTKGSADKLEKFIEEHCPQAQMIYKK